MLFACQKLSHLIPPPLYEIIHKKHVPDNEPVRLSVSGLKMGKKSALEGWKVQSKCVLQISLTQHTQQNFALSTCFI